MAELLSNSISLELSFCNNWIREDVNSPYPDLKIIHEWSLDDNMFSLIIPFIYYKLKYIFEIIYKVYISFYSVKVLKSIIVIMDFKTRIGKKRIDEKGNNDKIYRI